MEEIQQEIHVFSTRDLAWKAAGKAVEKCIEDLQETQEEIRMIFAAAPSQTGILNYLAASSKIKWEKIVAMHMDEYIGLPIGATQFFSKYLEENLFSKVPFKEVHLIRTHGSQELEINRYSDLLMKAPIDIVCLGIGENGHIAFNDPPVANFKDSVLIKKVQLDQACRAQQVHDGCFESLDDVPKTALTLTIPALMSGDNLFCVVLGENKSEAVKNTLTGPLSEACPATILRTHPQCKFYFDAAAVSKLPHAPLNTN
ncbi:6-phosphogluconolactonase [Algoriphagus halophilus]|uniref:Glucosamine-6-phosphate deaminase n=1 Tax=Algoriphagus halophilus TaxID=226505 RepID=A0A1N6HMQ2_9BACT|nr:6-phosphogluconolactonase [Algoriphagus halophilus]SIO21138.1 glucosamine-6-phosphate deaminase [Algoriphagus halophilus]